MSAASGSLDLLAQRARELPAEESMIPWIEAMLRAARDSLACGLERQAERLAERLGCVLAHAEGRHAHDRERAAARVDADWQKPPSRAEQLRGEIEKAVRRGLYALPDAEIAVLLRSLAGMDEPRLLELRGQLIWRRTRWLRSRRRPWNRPFRPVEDAPVGLYNNQGVTADVLETASRVAPLWVDDLLELERLFAGVDRMLGLAK
jgi:hypothetical protein